MTTRLSKWFTILGAVDPTDPTSNYRYARYNGSYNGQRDPIGQGIVGNVYPVTLLSSKLGALDAPNPPFEDPEGAAQGTVNELEVIEIEYQQRLSKWFTILGSVDPTNPTSPWQFARYNGYYEGKRDPIGQGVPGTVYMVNLLASKMGALDAPNPPFEDPEGVK